MKGHDRWHQFSACRSSHSPSRISPSFRLGAPSPENDRSAIDSPVFCWSESSIHKVPSWRERTCRAGVRVLRPVLLGTLFQFGTVARGSSLAAASLRDFLLDGQASSLNRTATGTPQFHRTTGFSSWLARLGTRRSQSALAVLESLHRRHRTT